MKILHISLSDNKGGAARAAYRIHKALLSLGVESLMMVQDANLDDLTVIGFSKKSQKILAYFRQYLAYLITLLLKTKNPTLHSPAFIPSNWLKIINKTDADIVHLHWVQGEMITISNISKIKKPVIWTLHDMWAFCGAEHISWDNRWKDGYLKKNRPSHESGFDLNRWVWNKKKINWKLPIHILTPSNWLANCVQESFLMKSWPVSVIPNPLNIDEWKPIKQEIARELLGFPLDCPLLLFGTFGANLDPNKGFDLLQEALNVLSLSSETPHELKLVIFGQKTPDSMPSLPFFTYYVGRFNDDISLRLLYSAADLVVVPSRIESFGQTASEAHSCGTPVVSFDTSGLKDIIIHKETGYLAKSFDPSDLANGINWILNNSNKNIIRENARQNAVNNFSSNIVAKKIINEYEKLLKIN